MTTIVSQSTFAISVHEAQSGRSIGLVDLRTPHLLPLMAELWREEFLRRGRTTVGLDDLEFTLQTAPGPARADVSVVLTARPRGTPEVVTSKRFTKGAFTQLVIDFCAKKVSAGDLYPGQEVCFAVHGAASSPVELPALSPASRSTLPTRHYHQFPARRMLPAVGEENSTTTRPDFTVIYTRHAFTQIERASRAGSMAQPPLETGCMLFGFACVSSDPADCYVVVTEALRIQAAKEQTFSLALTSESWSRVESYISTRCSEGLQILGTGHGHPFDPSADGTQCRVCPKNVSCGLHTAFLSNDDRRFMQAVFPMHCFPMQLAHVFGQGATNDCRNTLFTVRDGQLQARPFSVIESLPGDFLASVKHKG